MRFSIYFLLLVLTGCTNLSTDSSEDAKDTVVKVDGDKLFYNGSITSVANKTLFKISLVGVFLNN